MIEEKWRSRRITDSAQRILKQMPFRASDRGLHVVDESSIVTLLLWALLLWERKVGRVALERIGVDQFGLARDVDRLLDEKAKECPVVFDVERQQLLLAKTGEPYVPWDFESLLEPVLENSEKEAREFGHDYVGSEHLLLALINLAGPQLSDVLRQHSIDRSHTKAAVEEILNS